MPCCPAWYSVITIATSNKVSTQKTKNSMQFTHCDAAIRCGALKHKIVLAEKIENERKNEAHMAC